MISSTNFWHQVRLRIRDGIKGVSRAPSKFLKAVNFFSLRILFFFFNFFKFTILRTIYNRLNSPINLSVYRFRRSLFIIVSHPLYVTIHISRSSVKIAKKKKKIIIIPPPEKRITFTCSLRLFGSYLRNRIVTVPCLFDRSIKFSTPFGPTLYKL